MTDVREAITKVADGLVTSEVDVRWIMLDEGMLEAVIGADRFRVSVTRVPLAGDAPGDPREFPMLRLADWPLRAEPPVYDRGEQEIARHGYVLPRDDIGPHGGMAVTVSMMQASDRPSCTEHGGWQPLSWVVDHWECPVLDCEYRRGA